MKICTRCNVEKSFDNFYRIGKGTRGGPYRSWCKECYATQPRNDFRKYGLTPDSREALLDSVGRACEVCGVSHEDSVRGLMIDHDHKTGKIRGVLCKNCNLAEGFTRDNPDVLLGMIELMETKQWKNPRPQVFLPAAKDTSTQAAITKRSALKRKFNASKTNIDIMLEAQNFVCANDECQMPNIWNKKENQDWGLFIDHCHESGNIRFLLCSSCNAIDGHVSGNATVAQKLYDYLIRTSTIGEYSE